MGPRPPDAPYLCLRNSGLAKSHTVEDEVLQNRANEVQSSAPKFTQPDIEALVSVPTQDLQGYLAHQKLPTPLGPPQYPRHRPLVWWGPSRGVGVFLMSEVPL